MAPDIAIRPWDRGAEEDLVYDSWLKSLRHDLKHRNSDARHVRDSLWYSGQRQLITRLVLRPGTRWLVAECHGVIVGWACASASVLHYAYVKDAYRKCGVYMALLGQLWPGFEAITVSQLTRPLLRWKADGLDIAYDPFAIGD